jgi:hypothetical protein
MFVIVKTEGANRNLLTINGPFDTKESAIEWAEIDLAGSREPNLWFTRREDTLYLEDLRSKELGGTDARFEWRVSRLDMVGEGIGNWVVPELRADIKDGDYQITEVNGFVWGRIYDHTSSVSKALVRRLTGQQAKDKVKLSFDHVSSLILQEILTGKQAITLPLLQMAVDFTDMAADRDDENDMLHHKSADARQEAMVGLRTTMENLVNYVDTYNKIPETMLGDALELLRKYWSV